MTNHACRSAEDVYNGVFGIVSRIDIEEGEPRSGNQGGRAIVEAHPRVFPDPAPSVLLDHSADDSAIEIVVVFYTVDNEIAIVKSDL